MSTYQGNEPSQIVYTATAQVTGGRNGHAVSHEPELEFDLDTPVAMGGKGQGTNPEQLFAIGWGACFQGALALAAKLVERTQELCPYSKATAGNVPTEVVVVKSLD